MTYLGDFAAGATVRALLDSYDATGAAVTFGSLAAHVLKNGSASNLSNGVTVSADLDGTGVHIVSVDTSSSGSVYAVGNEYTVVITGTVSGVSVRRVLAQFSIGNRSTAAFSIPTTAQIADKVLGRNLAGSADGGRTVQDALRASRNKVVIDGTTITVYAENDSDVAWTGTVARDAALDPLTSVDPS